MSIFWNQHREADIGERLRSSGKTLEESTILVDDKWKQVRDLSDQDVLAMTPRDIASFSGMSVENLNEAIATSLREWRYNPARSMINIVANLEKPVPGHPMFADHLKQTLTLKGVVRALPDAIRQVGPFVDPNEPKRFHRGKNGVSLTVRSGEEAWINGLARSLRVWEMRNAALVRSGKVKLPKRLFRGVRGANINTEIKIERADRPFEAFSADVAQARRDFIAGTPIEEVFFSPILSFSANEDIARRFTNEEGFVIGLDPNDYNIVSSFTLDAALDEKDAILKKHEREWIVRLPPKAIIPEKDIEIWHHDWLMVNGDYRAIALVGHSSLARYQIGDTKLEAKFVYKSSGVGGSIRFEINDDWYPRTRAEAKKILGFDPVPQSSEMVSNLEFVHYDRHAFGDKKKERIMNVGSAPHVSRAFSI